jgi:diguanylate cyclase (GGDEF)-like protein
MATARRLGGVLWIFGALILAVILAVSPPTDRIGGAGWAIGAGVLSCCLLAALPLFKAPERISPDALLGMSYAGVALIAVLAWAGGIGAPYDELYIITVIYVSAVHPPRRVGAFLLFLVAALAAPLVYDGWNGDYAARALVELLLWCSLAAIALLFAATVRVNRMTLREGEEEASRLARRDQLTGLGNRRAFDESLGGMVDGGRRTDRPLSLVIADIEGFKAVNDLHGHLEGDRVLREVAGVVAAAVRAPDACFRWGGDEFAILLPSTDRDAAERVIERVQDNIGERVLLPGEGPLRLKYGLAEIMPEMGAADLIAAADLELMAAKAIER